MTHVVRVSEWSLVTHDFNVQTLEPSSRWGTGVSVLKKPIGRRILEPTGKGYTETNLSSDPVRVRILLFKGTYPPIKWWTVRGVWYGT